MLFWLVNSPRLAETSGVNSSLTTPHLFVATEFTTGSSTTRHARLPGAGVGSDMPTGGSISVNQAFTATGDELFTVMLIWFVLTLVEELTESPSESTVPGVVNVNVAELLVVAVFKIGCGCAAL